MVTINHKVQKNDGVNWKCGEVCLEMIYDHYNIKYDSDNIWEGIKTPRPTDIGHFYALTHKLALDAMRRDLYATIYKSIDLHSLKIVDLLKIPAVLSITQKRTGAGHYIVFSGINNNLYCYCDPDEENSISYMNEVEMKEAWKENKTQNVAGHIFVVFNNVLDGKTECPYCKRKVPIVHKRLTAFSKGMICPFCDSLFV